MLHKFINWLYSTWFWFWQPKKLRNYLEKRFFGQTTEEHNEEIVKVFKNLGFKYKHENGQIWLWTKDNSFETNDLVEKIKDAYAQSE